MYRTEKLASYIDEVISYEEIFPICIPSYNRPDATLLKKLKNKGLKVYLFIRKEQLKLYKKYKEVYNIITLEDVHDIGETRAAIVDWCIKNKISNIFLFDDDIYNIDYMAPGVTRNGNLVMRPACTNNSEGFDIWIRALKIWVYLIKHKCSRKVAISAPGGKADWWNIRYKGAPLKYNSSSLIQCIHLNIRLLAKNSLNYESVHIVGCEDYALQFKAMSKGLNTLVFKDLVYHCPSVGSTSGGCSELYENGLEEWRDESIELFLKNVVKNDSHPGIKQKTTKSGNKSIGFNWNYWRKL